MQQKMDSESIRINIVCLNGNAASNLCSLRIGSFDIKAALLVEGSDSCAIQLNLESISSRKGRLKQFTENCPFPFGLFAKFVHRLWDRVIRANFNPAIWKLNRAVLEALSPHDD